MKNIVLFEPAAKAVKGGLVTDINKAKLLFEMKLKEVK